MQNKELSDDFVLVIDSTGIKLTNYEEWLKEKCEEKSRKKILFILMIVNGFYVFYKNI